MFVKKAFAATVDLAGKAQEADLPGSDGDFGGWLGTMMGAIMILAVLLVFFFLIWGGIDWVTSGGDSSKVEKARNKIMQAIIGFIVLTASTAVIMVLQNFLGVEIFDFGNRGTGSTTTNSVASRNTSSGAGIRPAWGELPTERSSGGSETSESDNQPAVFPDTEESDNNPATNETSPSDTELINSFSELNSDLNSGNNIVTSLQSFIDESNFYTGELARLNNLEIAISVNNIQAQTPLGLVNVDPTTIRINMNGRNPQSVTEAITSALEEQNVSNLYVGAVRFHAISNDSIGLGIRGTLSGRDFTGTLSGINITLNQADSDVTGTTGFTETITLK